MIFYFTGTGNSLFAAKRLLSEGEKLINIAEAMANNEYDYTVQDDEKVGFVFPVYFYTLPSIVADFITNLKIKNADYVYAVITCGGSIIQAGSVLKKFLAPQNLKLEYVTSLLMPDNSMLFYQIPPVSKAGKRLSAAEKQLAKIKKSILENEKSEIGNLTFVSDLLGAGYKLCRKTSKYYADEKCISCGLCEKICPQNVIEIKDGKPQWTKAICSKCSACINRCPKNAIQYGKGTVKRNRYVNPELGDGTK